VGFTCATCGRFHEDELRDVRAALPEEIYELPEEERLLRAKLDSEGDFAILDDERCFVRALIEVPMRLEDDRFGWGVWVRLRSEDFDDLAERWTDPRAAGRTYRGWLATNLPAYGSTASLPGVLRLGAVDAIPSFALDDRTHPLAVEQRDGISLERARELADPYRQA
jgi:hypothetical protein